jgi:hypothetical protein
MTTNEGRATETSAERVMAAVMVVVFWTSFLALAAGLALWLAVPGSDAAALALASGLLGLLLIPMLRLIWVLAGASARRDWLTFGATLAVLAILIALTLRDAAMLR